ncbi:MAG: OmpA family protein [Candidatus Lernaella stagnicola]|nr:OmpA family protein [Candidatus Lernaella stagnicola]
MKKYLLIPVFVLVVGLLAPTVMAQDNNEEFDPDELLNIQLFRPSIFGGSFISFDDGDTLGTLGFHVGLLANYTAELLVDYDNDEPNFNYIEDLFTGNLMLAFGTWNFLSLGVDIPVHYINHRNMTLLTDPDEAAKQGILSPLDLEDEDPEGEFVFGDVRAAIKFGLLKQEKHWLNWAITPYVIFPTGEPDLFLGEGRTTGGGSTTIEHDFGPINIGLNGGYLYRGKSMLFGTDVGDAITWAAGVSKDWDNGFGLSVEYFGKYFDVQDTDAYRPLAQEVLGTLRYQFGKRGPRLIAGAGPGVSRGVGTPAYRVLAGIDYTYERPEKTDGIITVRTVDESGAEIAADVAFDGQEDDFNVDSSGEYKAEVAAGLYTITADRGGYESDTQAVEIAVDESKTITLTLKKIPVVPPTMLTIIVIDNDTGEQVASTLIFDRDSDKKSYDNPAGKLSEKWSPGEHTLMIRAAGHETLCTTVGIEKNKNNIYTFKLRTKLEKKGKVQFNIASAQLRPESYAVLDDVVEQIGQLCEYKKITVEGHTSNVGNDAYNMKLSQQRADTVRNYLIKKGIPAENLEVKAYGETKPIADNNTNKGREANRRVEFVIES